MKTVARVGVCALTFSVGALLAYGPPAFAKPYALIRLSKEKAEAAFIDLNTLKNNGYGGKSFWIVWVYAKNTSKYETFMSKDLVYINCDAKTFAYKASTAYDSYGNIMPNKGFKVENLDYIDIVPDSVADRELKIVCSEDPLTYNSTYEFDDADGVAKSVIDFLKSYNEPPK